MEGLHSRRQTELAEDLQEGSTGSDAGDVRVVHSDYDRTGVFSLAHAGHRLGKHRGTCRRLLKRLQVEGLEPALLYISSNDQGLVSHDAAAHLGHRDACY